MTLNSIKLIIWDMDDTFWNGTISEGEISPIPTNIQFIKNTSAMGIVHSICSKNDFDVVKEQLTRMDLWDYFVFPSIDWSPKGNRVLNIIQTMKLRAQNTLFVDDNIQNLKEAQYFCDGISVALPHEIAPLYQEAETAKKTDPDHKRLKQYHQLEQKESERNLFLSNEDFLKSCNIRVEICTDCLKEADRLHELILRSNQLNYTKFRQTKDDLISLLNSETANCGYVKVSDKFGDYGIVGFYAVENNHLIHFVFSCRTLGMQVEQYVYQQLGTPDIEITGDVAAPLEKDVNPVWINQEAPGNDAVPDNQSTAQCRILLKGPCDMSQMYTFLGNTDHIVTEFSYTNDAGILTEGHNHTSQILAALSLDQESKTSMISEVDFFDKAMFDTALLNQKFDVVVLSMLTDGNLGMYRHKETGAVVALCKKEYPLDSPKYAEQYINGQVFTSGISFSKENLENFSEKYEHIDNDAFNITIKNLDKLYRLFGKETTLVLLLGSEREFTKPCSESYKNRHTEHQLMNAKIRTWAENKANVVLIPYDNYIHSSSDFIDTINHFAKKVYYALALDLVSIFNEKTNLNAVTKGKVFLLLSSLRQWLRLLKSKVLRFFRKR